MTTRLVIVDDHPTFARTVAMLLGDGDIEVVGTASDGESGVALCLAEQPDIVLMDLQMPGIGGVEATRLLLASAPHIAVVVLTMFDDPDAVGEALRAGARGYLVKGSRRDEILRTIELVASGHAVVGRDVARHLQQISSQPVRPRAFPDLTQRELEVLAGIADGLDNRAIARRLFLSEKTVRNYVSVVLSKLQVATRSEAIVVARREGVGSA